MSFFGKLFGGGSSNKNSDNTKTKSESSHHSSAATKSGHSSQTSKGQTAKSKGSTTGGSTAAGSKPGTRSSTGQGSGATKRSQNVGARKPNTSKRRGRKTGKKSNILIDISKPLVFPATPELILAHHKNKPFLDQNEEWLVVELNQFECLVDNLEIIRIIAKHSKFFEIEPDELWTEFFEFVDEVPSYDEVINYDVWQEFRDVKYPC